MVETRIITQTRYYFLVMNPMTDRAESRQIVACSTDRQRLIDFHEGEKVEGYRDDRYLKTFRQGTILEWYNPLDTFDVTQSIWGHGIFSEWINEGDLNQSIPII